MSNQQLVVSEATASDIPECMATQFGAFAGGNDRLVMGDDTADNRDIAGKHLLIMKENDKYLHIIKATNEENKIVGYCIWSIVPDGYSDANELEHISFFDINFEKDRAKAKADYDRIVRPILEWRARNIANDPHAILMYLAVRPGYQRQGVGTALLQWGLDRCDQLGIKAYLEASEQGLGLYKKHGFVVVDEIKTDWGQDGGSVPALTRSPHTKKMR